MTKNIIDAGQVEQHNAKQRVVVGLQRGALGGVVLLDLAGVDDVGGHGCLLYCGASVRFSG